MDEVMQMYDTEQVQDAVQLKRERSVHSWMRAAAYAAGSEADDEPLPAAVYAAGSEADDELFAQLQSPPLDEIDFGQAVERKKRDNLALGEALVSIGLLGRIELAGVERAQTESEDLVASLMIASAIRSRLGEILLKAKQITTCQLEFALELQRHQGGLLGETLVSLGWLDQATLDAALAAQAGCVAA
jgi:hypothetical protein